MSYSTPDTKSVEDEIDNLGSRISMRWLYLKREDPSSSKYWTLAASIARMESKYADLKYKVYAIRDGIEDERKAHSQLLRAKAAEKEEKIFEDQAERLKDGSQKPKRQAFVELFAKRKGPKAKSCGCECHILESDQSKFRKACIEKYNSRHPKWSFDWCPVLKKYNTYPIAIHLFNPLHGQNVMSAIFGHTKESELFSPLNGLMVEGRVAEYINSGYLAIVPNVPDEPSEAEIRTWNNSDPKEYKIRILDLKWTLTSIIIDDNVSRRCWGELDGEKLEFKSNFRPSVEYLYFLYVTQMLNLALINGTKPMELKAEVKKFWGVPGPYLPKSVLLGLVDMMGHEYDSLLEGAVQDSWWKKKDQDTMETEQAIGLLTILHQIKKTDEDLEEYSDLDSDSDGSNDKWELL